MLLTGMYANKVGPTADGEAVIKLHIKVQRLSKLDGIQE